jgi:uncharacterized membrane protein YcjF (UPF0283 family)
MHDTNDLAVTLVPTFLFVLAVIALLKLLVIEIEHLMRITASAKLRRGRRQQGGRARGAAGAIVQDAALSSLSQPDDSDNRRSINSVRCRRITRANSTDGRH